jgi:hypothetical protein
MLHPKVDFPFQLAPNILECPDGISDRLPITVFLNSVNLLVVMAQDSEQFRSLYIIWLESD